MAFDNYFTGDATDAIEDMVFTPAVPRFTTGALQVGTLAPFSRGTINVSGVDGGAAASPSQAGLLLMYSDAQVEAEAIPVRVRASRD